MSRDIQIALLGLTGRLGGAIGRTILATPGFALSGAAVRAGSPVEGGDIGRYLTGKSNGVTAVVSLEDAMSDCDIVIDASLPELTEAAAKILAEKGNIPLVSGVTGLNSKQQDGLVKAAGTIPVLQAGNFSLGVAMAERLVRMASSLPAADWDIEIEESHHRMKADAPSGTALMLGQAAAQGRGEALDDVADWARHGHTGARETGRIGFAVTRGGGIIGEHAVRFLAELEDITIAHRAHDRDVFARGAVEAARWILNEGEPRPAGLYSMQDVVRG